MRRKEMSSVKDYEIIYEPVWRVSLKNELWKHKRLWCVYDRITNRCYYGKKKKYAIQKYEKALGEKK